MSQIIIEEWRDLWSFKSDFVFASLAWSFASSNFLNINQDVAEHGGAAYLVAYGASLLAVCLPILIMELAVGQLTGRAPVQALFNICPLFKGVGVGQIMYCLLLMSVFGIQLSYVFLHIFYLFLNILGDIPWLNCATSLWDWQMGQTCIATNRTAPYLTSSNFTESSSQRFLEGLVHASENIQEAGGFQWRLIAALGVVWFCVFLAIFGGVRWLGKVCYFTFLIPMVFLLAILVNAVVKYQTERETKSSPSGVELIVTLLAPDWNVLLLKSTWMLALSRSIYGVGVGFGVYITLGSYNKRNNNLVGDSFLIIFVHVLSTAGQLFTFLMVVGALGPREAETGNHIPRGYDFYWRLLGSFAEFGVSKLWSGLLLFVMAFMVLNYLYIMSLSVLATLEDAFGEKSSRFLPRFGLALLITILGFSLGLGHTLQSGKYATMMMEYFMDQLTLWVLVTVEIIAVAWFYCAHFLGKDIKTMVGGICNWLIGFLFSYILYILPAAPIYVLVVKLGYQYDFFGGKNNQVSEGGYSFSNPSLPASITGYEWTEPVGWAIAALPLLPIPLLILYIITRTCIRGPGLTPCQRLKYAVISPLRYEIVKPTPPPRYTATAPGYVLLPQNQWHEMA